MGERTGAAELVCLGRVSVDLYGEQVGADLRSTQSFQRYIGGSAGNTAVAASRLGLDVALMSQVGQDGFGEYLESRLKAEMVRTNSVHRTAGRSTGTIALAPHVGQNFPRMLLVEAPAEFAMTAEMVDDEMIQNANALLVGGTYLSTPDLRDATVAAVEAARRGGGNVVFDIDYRPAFWGVAARSTVEDETSVTPEVTQGLQVVLDRCDVVVGTVAEFRALGGDSDLRIALREVRQRTTALLVVKHGPDGCSAFPDEIPPDLGSARSSVDVTGFPVKTFNSVGAGDAFMAGFLRGYLRRETLDTCLTWGNACGAIVASRLACSDASPSMRELQRFLSAPASPSGAYEISPLLDREQRATMTRHRDRDDLAILAMDHRGVFEKLAADAGRDHGDVARLKRLLLSAFRTVADERANTGVLVDEKFVDQVELEYLNDCEYWVSRALELNGQIPVEFLGNGDPAGIVRSWPIETVVKVLVREAATYDATSQIQTERLESISRICRNLNRDLLVEVLPRPGTEYGETDLPIILDRYYRAGIMPDWWKLPPQATFERWREVGSVVRQNDPLCRGMLMLGGPGNRSAIGEAMAAAGQEPLVKGVAVGRNIFQEPAKQWLRGSIDDGSLVTQIAHSYRSVVDDWNRARAAA